MPDQPDDQTTQSLREEITTRLDRIESLIGSLSNQVSTLQASVDQIAQTQRDMYVDLRERIKLVHEKVHFVQREVEQFIRDQEPDSLQSRLLSRDR